MFSSFGALNWIQHIIVPGESLSQIANKYGSDVTTIARQNGIIDVNLIRVGELLDIPVEDAEATKYIESQGAPRTFSTSAAPTAPAIPKLPFEIRIPTFLQGQIFGMPKLFVYPAILIGVGIIVYRMTKKDKVAPIRRQPLKSYEL